MVYADLHVHTVYSDGIHSIEEVVKLAKEKGIQVIAITDHDTVFHYDQIKEICDRYSIETIRGVEMSCYDQRVSKKVHIIGLWLNDHPDHVEQLCRETLRCRDAYHHKLIKELREKGLNITYEEAKSYAPYNIVFKMHLFQAIVDKYPEYNDMKKYRELFSGRTSKEVDLQMGYIDVQKGIEAIRKDGGIAILAHPCEYDNYPEIENYVAYGLRGIEVSHPSMREEDYMLIPKYIDKFHLLPSGGSDFHNKNLTAMGKQGLSYQQYRLLKECVENETDKCQKF